VPVTDKNFHAKRGKARWCYALIVWLVASFSVGSVTSVSADTANPAIGHQSGQSMHVQSSGHNMPGLASSGLTELNGSAEDMPAEHDHSQMQCCMVSCVVSCAGLLTAGFFDNLRLSSIYTFAAKDPLLRPQFLDSDPPVPRT
jgi:hypothetical protein